MENNMTDNERFEPLFIALKLTIICFCSVLLLLIINIITSPIIEDNKKKAEDNAYKELAPQGKKFVLKTFSGIDSSLNKDFYYNEVYDRNDEIIGYIVSSIGKGYGGKMKVLIYFDNELKILNVKLLDNAETPGLGKKAEKSDYMLKFIGKNVEGNPLPENKNMLSQEERDSITGATITFNGLVQAIKEGLRLVENQL